MFDDSHLSSGTSRIPVEFSLYLCIDIEVISTWNLCHQNFSLKKNILWVVRIYATPETYFWRRYVCHCPHALPLTCSPSRGPSFLANWFLVRFCQEKSSAGDRRFEGGEDRRYCHPFSF